MNLNETHTLDGLEAVVSEFINNLLQRVCDEIVSGRNLNEHHPTDQALISPTESDQSIWAESNCHEAPFTQIDSGIVLTSLEECWLTIQDILDSLEQNNSDNSGIAPVGDSSVGLVSNPCLCPSNIPTATSQINDITTSTPMSDNNFPCEFLDEFSGVQGVCSTENGQDLLNMMPSDAESECVSVHNVSVQSERSSDCSPSEGQPEYDKWDDSLLKSTVPVGWLSTLSNRKQKNYTTPSKWQTRKQDFVYCGPAKQDCSTAEKTDVNKNFMDDHHCSVSLATPTQASQIPIEILYSGIALTPGVLDKNGNHILVVLCDDIVWQKCDSGAIGLAQFLLYLSHRMHDVSILVDERNASAMSLREVFDALNIFQSNCHCCVRDLFVLGGEDECTSETLRDIFNVKPKEVESIDELSRVVDLDNLPCQLGGMAGYSQADWVQTRLTVDCFVDFCENVRHNFARQTLSVTSHTLPGTLDETRTMLSHHHRDMSQLLDEKQLGNLHARGRRLMEQLTNQNNPDISSSRQAVEMSYHSANDAVSHFVRIADERLLALERHLLVKQFEQSCDCIFRWTSRHWRTLRDEYSEIEDSFESLLVQSNNFERFYLEVMQQYAKCDCLLSDAKHLAELGYISQVELIQRARLAEEEINKVVNEMENKRQEVEAASQMLKFIDQAYSWALDGMKFVAMLNMESCVTTEACNKMLTQFDDYMQNHPSIPKCQFSDMLELARRFANGKCLRQCEFAQQKCDETAELFTKRRELIAKAMAQIKGSAKKRPTSFRMRHREKLDQPMKVKQDHEARSPTPSDDHRISVRSLDEKASNDEMSTVSHDSFSEDAISCSSSSHDHATVANGQDEACELPPSNRIKPVRKMLKKSATMPAPQMESIQKLLHSQSGITIGSPVQVQDEIPEGRTKISLIVDELVSTEREYVKSLNYVIDHYFPEMCRLDIPQALRCKRNVIFGNIEKIAEFHSQCFLNDLELCKGNPMLVAQAFQKNKEGFGLYALYSKNKPQSDLLLSEHGNEFFKAKQVELGDKMDLASYLLKPVQRMGKYALLLHAMAKRTTGNEERCLKEAEELVKFQLRHGNDLLTMDSIRDCDVNLKEQGNLLRQEQFVILTGRKKIIRRVFLFEELILFSKPIHVHGGHDTYQYKCSYKTAEIGLTENIGDSGFKFEIWFRRRRSQLNGDKFVLQSSTRSIKRCWVEEIRNLLWKQALRNKDRRRNEMSSMGIGSKPHLDLVESSENTIVNRSVGTVSPNDKMLAGRLIKSRTRASIAVSSFDHGTLNCKRPHSIISTSSSTSSVGSGGNQLVSSLSLATWSNRDSSRSQSQSTPPMAYCDFHAIAEDEESTESPSEDRSSESPVENSPEHQNETTTHQYVTTHSPINI